MSKTILLVHGRHFKPPKESLKKLWTEALRHGIQRDREDAISAFDSVNIELVYYGNHSNDFLSQALNIPYKNDTSSRRKTLEQLKQYRRRDFNRRNYENLPGRDWVPEALADVFGGILSALRLSDLAIKKAAPDMGEYWNRESEFGSKVRFQMISPLKKAMDRDDKIMVISHSLGTMISYDTFWKFCRMGEYRPKYTDKKIDLWLTLGSPLGDETVRRRVRGASLVGERRFPNNIRRWINVAAEDDFISHDQNVANDYQGMKKHRLIRSITDKRIYNLALRNGKANPHHGAGYLIHPYVAGVVAKWCKSS